MGRNPQTNKHRQPHQNSKRESKRDNKKSIPAKKPEETSRLVFPGGDTAFKALLSARFCAAIWSHITDCDETYNYWEPMHYLVFGKGLQTWEYSPEFALRSYTYLLFHAAPAFIYHKLLQPNPLLIFYFIRCLLGLVCAFAEVYFYKAVCKEFGVHIGRIMLAFQLFAAGMFISSTALLPSSWAMYLTFASCAAWWQGRYPLAVFFVALSALLGWPFAALLGVPIAMDMIFRQKLYQDFVLWSAVSAVAILGPMIAIDSMYFRKIVVAPWNIVWYNVFGGAGPELYGTEPFSFYIINGVLNFNIVWILSLLSPFMLLLNHFLVPAKTKSTLNFPHWVSLSPFFLWLAVFLFQKHKEERFLFPVYPFVSLCGAVSVDVLQKLWFRLTSWFKKSAPGAHYLDCSTFIMIGVIAASSLMGLSRIFSLYRNFHAPLDLMMELNRFPAEGNVPKDTVVNVCLAKDWYRFPSSFFLPNKNWNVRFVKSEFNGMLPAPYSELENATSVVHGYFNDQNKENPNVYFDINKCHFMLDLDTGKQSPLEPVYAKQKARWKIVKSVRFLDAENSHPFFRAFYVPFVSDRFIVFGDFYLLQSLKFKYG